MMANRLINGGFHRIGGEELLAILENVSSDERARPEAKSSARKFVEYQRKKQEDVSHFYRHRCHAAGRFKR
jgi:hypothetical protein